MFCFLASETGSNWLLHCNNLPKTEPLGDSELKEAPILQNEKIKKNAKFRGVEFVLCVKFFSDERCIEICYATERKNIDKTSKKKYVRIYINTY